MKYVRLALVLMLTLVTSPGLHAQVAAALPYAQDELLVRFAGAVSRAQSDNVLARLGARAVERYQMVANLVRVRLPRDVDLAGAVRALQAQPGVLYAEPNYTVHALVTPNDTRFNDLWGLHNSGQFDGVADVDIDAPEAWNITTGSSSVVVAVIDTGIDYTHPDLAANMFRNEPECDTDGVDDDGNGYIDDCYGIDTVNDDSDPFDDGLHGTHVAGTIGAVGNNGMGVVGVNWNVKLMACKFLDDFGSGATSGAIACLDYLATMKDRGVNIVASNNSWGGGAFSRSLLDAIDAQRQRGTLFIAAAGNAALDIDSEETYPASYFLPNIITVASITRTGALSDFSDYGRSRVHLGAPGSDIWSTLPGNSYDSFSGTSMATPHVTGVAALLKAQDASRDWRAIRNLILAGGDDSSALAGKSVTGKRLNAAGALTCANRVVKSRLQPAGTTVVANVNESLVVAVLNINCAQPNGSVSVTATVDAGGPSSRAVPLLDNGVAPDQAAGDGVYSGEISFSTYGNHTVTFPDGEHVSVQVLHDYTHQTAAYEYRNFIGTSLDIALDESKPLDTPFPIHFGGGSFSRLHLSPNGIVGVSAPHIAYFNVPIPLPSNKAFVAAFWDDLFPTFPTPGNDRNIFWTVLGTSPNRELVIEWRNLPHYDCQDEAVSVRFQVVFFEGSARVLINYADTIMGGSCTFADQGDSATIGIQVGSNRGTLQWFDGPLTESGTATLWTTIAPFTDETVTGGAIKLVHIRELRDRIDAVRTFRGMSAYNWTDPALTPGVSVIRAIHFQELRTALDEAYVAAQRTPPTYTDPTIVAGATVIKAAHITELRSAVVALE